MVRALLAACVLALASAPHSAAQPPEAQAMKPLLNPFPPDSVDYLASVQCAGLYCALETLAPTPADAERLASDALTFGAWAEYKVGAERKPAEVAGKDIAASVADFLVMAGEGSVSDRRERLSAAQEGGMKSCRSFADNALVVIVLAG